MYLLKKLEYPLCVQKLVLKVETLEEIKNLVLKVEAWEEIKISAES
jgi:hypothetical protein